MYQNVSTKKKKLEPLSKSGGWKIHDMFVPHGHPEKSGEAIRKNQNPLVTRLASAFFTQTEGQHDRMSRMIQDVVPAAAICLGGFYLSFGSSRKLQNHF